MNGHFLLKARRLISGATDLVDGVVEVSEGRIVYAGPPRATDAGEQALDLGDSILAPGFVDLHMHGNGGAWWGQSVEDDRNIARRMVASGTTSCLASLGGRRTLDEVLRGIGTTAASVGAAEEGAEILGIHMEGPFISPEKRGAWLPAQLRPPSVKELRLMQGAAGGAIRTVTIAPELPGALEVAAEAAELGIRPAIGHTDATYEEAMAGVDAGMTYATHTFNAMRGLHHRDPGALGALLAGEVDCELIADGQHVAEGAIRVLLAAKGAERIMLVTDNVAMAGMEPGEYGDGQWSVQVSEDGVRLADGTIAGSVLPFNRHVANMAHIAGASEAIRMATANPARAIGVDDRKGLLEAGKDADIVALSPDLEVRLTITRGRVVYRDPAFELPARMAGVG